MRAGGAVSCALMKTRILVLAGVLLALGALLLVPRLLDWRSRHAADEQLQAQAVYQVLRKHEPGVYARVLAKLQAVDQGAVTRAEFVNFANFELSTAATRRLAHASDEAVNALLADMIANARLLAQQPGDQCFRFLFPHVAGPADVAGRIDPQAQARTLDRLAEVIRSSAESPVPLPDAQAVQDKLADVVNATYEQYGTDAQMVAHVEDPRVDRAKVCTITLSLYERIMAWPPADSSALIRVMTQVE
jgi:hypothetical protein